MPTIFTVFVLLFTFISGVMFADRTQKSEQKEKSAWSTEDSKAYAQDKLAEWQHEQWLCLDNLWSKESNWRPTAYNKVKVMGKNAGGIPQLLGLDPTTPPTIQIERGLDYIYNRYKTPCEAWEFHKKKGNY